MVWWRFGREARHRQRLGRAIMAVYDRLAQGALREDDLVAAPFETPRSWARQFATSRGVHEPDARILARISGRLGTILDIGAHWGYLAMSLRHAGGDAPILSFEPMEAHHGCLEEVRQLYPEFDFLPLALGEREATATLYGPVVNGQPIMGLHSIDGRIFNEHSRDHLLSLLGGEIPFAQHYDFRLTATRLVTRRLDDVLRTRPSARVGTEHIAALKLDVEGHEAPVLRGAGATLANERPFIMVESGNRHPEVAGLLSALRYRYAERLGDHLVETTAQSKAPNGFWFAPELRDRYAAAGLF